MANEQEQLNSIQSLHFRTTSTLKYLRPLFLGLVGLEKAPPADKQAELEKLLRPVQEKVDLTDVQKLISELHGLPYVENDKDLKKIWPYFLDVKGNTDAFFQDSSLQNPELLDPLVKFLRLSEIQLNTQLRILREPAEKAAQREKAAPVPVSAQPFIPPIPITPAEKAPVARSAEIERQAREQQKAFVDRARRLYLLYKGRFEEINRILPEEKRFSDQEIENISRVVVEEGAKPGVLDVTEILENQLVAPHLTGVQEEVASRIRADFSSMRDFVEANPEFAFPPPLAVPPTPLPQAPTTPIPSEQGAPAIPPPTEMTEKPGVQRARSLIIEHEGRLIDINDLIPTTRRFEKKDILNLDEAARLSTLFPEKNIDVFLQEYGLLEKIDPNNLRAIEDLRDVFRSVRGSMLSEQTANGQTLGEIRATTPEEQVEIQRSVISMTRSLKQFRYGNANTVVQALTTKGTDIKQKPAQEKWALDGIRKEFLSSQIDARAEQNIFSRSLNYLQQSVGLETQSQKARKSFADEVELVVASYDTESIIEASDGYSVLDIIGSPSTTEVSTFDDSGEAVAPSPGLNPLELKNKAERLKMFAGTAKSLAANPLVVGALGVGAGTAISALTYGVGAAPYALAGGAAGAWTGFQIGAAVGSFLGPVGTVVGGLVGAGVGGLTGAIGAGYASTQITIGGQSLASATGQAIFGIGQAAPGAAAAAGQGLAAAAPTAAAGISSAGAGISSAANTAVASSSQFLGAMQGLPSFMNTFAASAGVVAGPIGAVAFVTIAVVVPTLIGTFLGPNQGAGDENKYVTFTKLPNQGGTPFSHADHPEPVTYTISAQAKPGYTITITEIKDEETLISKGKPKKRTELYDPQPDLDKLKAAPIAEGQETSISYTIPYDTSYEDTRVNNTVTIKFNVSGLETLPDQSFIANAVISFGNPPAFACWPTTGRINQGPFGPFSHAPPGNRYGVYLDAVDIGGKKGTNIFTPFTGQASLFNEQKEAKGCAAGGYGNCVKLSANGGLFIFGHFNEFAAGLSPGGTYTVEPGQLIGYMGTTGYSFGDHLHYEWRPGGANAGAAASDPGESGLEKFVPEPIQYASPREVTKQQYVRSDQCSGLPGGLSATASGQLVKNLGCFNLISGDEQWGHADEASQKNSGAGEVEFVSKEITQMFSDSRINKILCGSGKTISIIRTRAGYADGGCRIGQGSSGGYVDTANSIHICDKVFTNYENYGFSTIWHEPGHIIQFQSTDWKKYFHDYVPNYIPSYPIELGRSWAEDFAEAWGMCNRTRITNQTGYRSVPTLYDGLDPYSSKQCADIEKFMNEKGS